MNVSVRELEPHDTPYVVDYFKKGDPQFLKGMGVAIEKLPDRHDWIDLINGQLELDYPEKEFYYIIWQVDEQPVGHSNINKITFGKEAYMHLHLWPSEQRQQGLGSEFVRKTIPYYFSNFELERLYCEPNAYNPAPNKTLKKVGFEFIQTYQPPAGWINFPQELNSYVITKQELDLRI